MVLELLGLSCGSENQDVETVFESKSHDEYNPEITDIPILECNYDTHTHGLYSALERREWDEAAKLLPLGNEDQSPAIGEEKKAENAESTEDTEESKDAAQASEKSLAKHEVLARAWIVRKNDDGEVKWRMLPIHGAVIFDAPKDILERLLKIHPEGAKLKDDAGNLPLHLGYSEGRSVEIVELLKNAYPEGEAIRNNKGHVPGENFGPSAAVRKVKEDTEKQLAELDEVHKSQIDEKDKEIADMKEKFEVEMKTLKEVNDNEIETLNERLGKKGEEHEAALRKITDEKDGEIEKLKEDLAQQQREIQEMKGKSQLEQRTAAPADAAVSTPQGLRKTKKSTKSKSFFTKVGFSSRTVLSKAEVPVVPAKKVPPRSNSLASDQQNAAPNKEATGKPKSQVAAAE